MPLLPAYHTAKAALLRCNLLTQLWLAGRMPRGMDRIEPTNETTQRVPGRQWLSAGLIAVGLLFLIAAGVLAAMNAAMLTKPPPRGAPVRESFARHRGRRLAR